MGANRYYGRNILTYALYKAQNGGMENIYDYASDDSPAADGWFAANDFDGLERLKTPFSDEFSIGLTQRLGDWSASAAYVHRNGHDEVRSRSRTEGSGYDTRFVREFYNGGESEHDSVIFSINNTAPLKFAKANHWVRFSAAWQEPKSNAAIDQGYSELESGKTVNMDKVWYDGSVIDAEDLDSTDFNIPVKFDLEATSEWAQWGLTWYNFLHLSLDRSQAVRDDGEYYAWTHEGEYGPMTEQIRKYSRVDFASAWSWDTKVLYRPDWARGVGVSLEVYNVTNNRNASDVFVYKGTQYKSYDPGRQFWVQLSGFSRGSAGPHSNPDPAGRRTTPPPGPLLTSIQVPCISSRPSGGSCVPSGCRAQGARALACCFWPSSACRFRPSGSPCASTPGTAPSSMPFRPWTAGRSTRFFWNSSRSSRPSCSSSSMRTGCARSS